MTDSTVIRNLYEKYAFIIHGRCRRILRCESDAWDATQSVFLKLLEQYDSIRDKEKVVPWIFMAAQNVCFNSLRSRKKFVEGLEPDTLPRNEHTAERIGDRQILGQLLQVEDRRVREAAYFTFVEELDQEQIRTLTGQSPATIRRNLAKFKEHCTRVSRRLGL